MSKEPEEFNKNEQLIRGTFEIAMSSFAEEKASNENKDELSDDILFLKNEDRQITKEKIFSILSKKHPYPGYRKAFDSTWDNLVSKKLI